jgi:hypothetical protein
MVKNTNMLMITTIILLIKILPEALKETPIYIPGNNSRRKHQGIFKEQMEDKYGY